MAVVPRELLLRQTARIRPAFDRAQAEAQLLENIRAADPEFDPDRDEIIQRALPLIAEAGFVLVEMAVNAVDASLLARAMGDDLVDIGIDRGVLPIAGEDPDDYRERIANASGRSIPVTLGDYRTAVPNWDPGIVDVQPVRNPANRDEVFIYALRADLTALTADERTALSAHFTLEDNKMANLVGVSAKEVTQTPYDLTMTVHHKAGVIPSSIAETVRLAVEEYVEAEQRIGAAVYLSKLQGLATRFEDVVRVELTSPSADLDAVAGTIHTLDLDSDVTINTAVA